MFVRFLAFPHHCLRLFCSLSLVCEKYPADFTLSLMVSCPLMSIR